MVQHRVPAYTIEKLWSHLLAEEANQQLENSDSASFPNSTVTLYSSTTRRAPSGQGQRGTPTAPYRPSGLLLQPSVAPTQRRGGRSSRHPYGEDNSR